MIDKNYIYLATAKELDDPFECWTTIDFSEIFEGNDGVLNDNTMNLIFHEILSFLDSQEKKNIVENIYRNSIINGDFSNHMALEQMMEYSNIFNSFEQRIIINTFANFKSTFDPKTRGSEIRSMILTARNAKDSVGIFSLAESNTNSDMWETYADNDKGCCIEYDFTNLEQVKNLYPVIYEPKKQHNILKALIEFNANMLVRRFSDGEIRRNVSQLLAPYLTKELKWAYQDEWRILGNAHSKAIKLRIKSIYLGNNVSEEKFKYLKDRSLKFGFKLYKKQVDRNKRINFLEIK